jgi:hypothetical protein
MPRPEAEEHQRRFPGLEVSTNTMRPRRAGRLTYMFESGFLTFRGNAHRLSRAPWAR